MTGVEPGGQLRNRHIRSRSAAFRLPWRIATSFVEDPRFIALALRGLPSFLRELRRYHRMQTKARPSFRIRIRYLYPRLADRFLDSGVARGHYFHQDIWAARRIYEAAPARHFDIGSRIDGFIGHLLSFREVTVMDLRPLGGTHPGLSFLQADMTALPHTDGSIDSISCLHAVEHVGLGRYGDAVDPDGCWTAMKELQRVLAPGGRLYFSAPIGRERVEFNAHRVFAPETILNFFSELDLVEFAAVDDEGHFVQGVVPADLEDAFYACGLFLFEGRQSSQR